MREGENESCHLPPVNFFTLRLAMDTAPDVLRTLPLLSLQREIARGYLSTLSPEEIVDMVL